MKHKKISNWNPQNANEEIEGKIISIEEEVEIRGHKIKIYTIETEKEVKEVFGATVLNEKIRSICHVGTNVKIVYLGKKQGQGEEYKDYDVYLGCKE